MKEAHLSGSQRFPHGGFRHILPKVHAKLERAFCLKRSHLQELFCAHIVTYLPWNVRLITSICCSRVSRTKFTAYPETRIVRWGYFSGWSIASRSVSRLSTFTFM